METKHIIIDRKNVNEEELREAASIIREGKLVAFPTETVYGLGGDALDASAAKRIYEAKGRPSDNPLIVHIADVAALSFLAVDIPDAAYQLAKEFWPGPLTMILKKSDVVPKSTTGGLDTVAIRFPSDEIAQAIIRLSGCYIAAPSANASGRPSTTCAEHVMEDLNGRIEMVVDGGPVRIGLESTILDLTEKIPVILRPGYITKQQLENCIGKVRVDKGIMKTKKEEGAAVVAKAPGMKYRHYAPKGQLTIYEGESSSVISCINQKIAEKMKEGALVGIIATEETKDSYIGGMIRSIGSRYDEEAIAAHLFQILREFDSLHAEYIYSESFTDNRLGHAIMNRLMKAAGYNIEKV